jgi:hypothetical protein
LVGRVRQGAPGEQGLAQEQQLPGAARQDQTGAPPGAEHRSAPRYALLIRTAKIIADGREFLCIIRDASASGLKIRLFVELMTGDRYPVELVWMAEDYAGLRFTHEIDIERLLDESKGAYPKRQIRLQIAIGGMLHSGGEAVPVIFHNLSQQGAWIETGVTPPLFAKVRWRSHPRYGMIFEHTFRLEELARISAPLQFAEALEQHARGSESEPSAGEA